MEWWDDYRRLAREHVGEERRRTFTFLVEAYRAPTLIKTDPGALKNNGPSKCAGSSTARSLVGLG
jgi:hypothetical protein